ncbi:hypothetical protein AMTRI_Chr07g29130 [Amborella trichopoda]
MDFVKGLPVSKGKYVILVVFDRLSKYAQFIPLFHPHIATGVAQVFFDQVFKLPPPSLLTYVSGTARVETIERQLLDRDLMIKELYATLKEAQNRMKKLYESHHQERELAEGDWVYLILQPYRQSTLALRKNLKLSLRYYGPYMIVKKIGVVAYKVGSEGILVQSELPTVREDDDILHPQAIVDQRVNKRRKQILIHWQGMLPAEATWEDLEAKKKHFPEFSLEDKTEF